MSLSKTPLEIGSAEISLFVRFPDHPTVADAYDGRRVTVTMANVTIYDTRFGEDEPGVATYSIDARGYLEGRYGMRDSIVRDLVLSRDDQIVLIDRLRSWFGGVTV
jgi:hypothetical protein